MKSWDEDLFDRRGLANDLVEYAASVSRNGSLLKEDRSLVIGVDAEYGIGKTYFLKGLEMELQGRHPVAYIDAWSDDLFDEPLIALASVIKRSIEPLLQSDPEVKKSWVKFLNKSGKVLWIGTKGAAKRAAQVAITGGTVEVISEVWSDLSEDQVDQIEEGMDKIVSGTVDDIDEALKAISSNQDLATRMAEFEAGRKSMRDMATSLEALIETLDATDVKKPIFIIVDELDRCRPGYAIKFLEEVKHLFSVPGLVFVLGLNSAQLGRAVSGLYGDKFDGLSYLSRFIDRSVKLPFPPLVLLVEKLISDIQNFDRVKFPNIRSDSAMISASEYISLLLEYWGVAPRDVFKFFDRLQTCLALTGSLSLEGIFLTELIAEELGNGESKASRGWQFGFMGFGPSQWVEADSVSKTIRDVFSQSNRDAIKRLSSDSTFDEYFVRFLGGQNSRAQPTGYRSLLNDVCSLGE